MALFRKCARGALALVLFMGLATGARALPAVQSMFVFGDSLSDPGNAAALTPVVPGLSFFPPSNPGIVLGFVLPYDYRFSNGPVAAEYLAGLLGIAPSEPAWPSAPASPNYAVGGAMTGPQSGPIGPLCCNFNWLIDSPAGLASLPAVQTTGLNDQITLFGTRLLGGEVSFDPATTLFTVWGGPNDIFLALALAQQLMLPPDQAAALLQLYAQTAVQNLANNIGALAALGAERFLVLNMPNLGATPSAAGLGLQAELTALSAGFNFGLATVLDILRGILGVDILAFDTFGALDDLIASGLFPNTTQPCFEANDPQGSIARIVGGCQGYLFFDGVHPTTAVHAILAQQLARVVPEPAPLLLLAAMVLALAWVRRRKR
jgi:phospholipase/lecithinase/hemolysin